MAKRKEKKERIDMAVQITESILAELGKGEVPWRKPWEGGFPENVSTARAYRGVNILILNLARQRNEYEHNQWLTYRQAQGLGGHVSKGEHGTRIVFWKFVEMKGKRDEDEETVRIPLMRGYTVFNVAQCEDVKVPEKGQPVEPIAEAEAILDAYKGAPVLKHDGGDRAFYRPATDSIHMPEKDTFESPAAYYSVVFHEEVHGTGHGTRLNRESLAGPISSHGGEAYSREELVAEFGAAFLVGMTGGRYIAKTLENSAAYIQHWMAKIKDDPKLLVRASSAAQKAVDWICEDRPDMPEPKPKQEPAPEPAPVIVEPEPEPEPEPKSEKGTLRSIVDAVALRKAIKIVKPALARKGIPLITSLFLEGKGDKLHIHGGTGSHILTYTIPATIESEGKVLVKPKVLDTFLKGKKGPFTIDGSQYGSQEEYMELEPVKEDFLVGDLNTAFKKAAGYVSCEDDRDFLNGVYLNNESGSMETWATTGKILKIAPVKSRVQKKVSVIIPTHAANLLSMDHWAGKVSVGIAKTPGRVSFSNGDMRLLVWPIQGDFPDAHAIGERKPDIEVTFDKEKFLEASLQAASPHGKNESLGVRMDVTKTSIKLHTGPLRNGGNPVEVKLECASDAEMLTAFNHRLMLRCLDSLDGDKITIKTCKDGITPMSLSSSDSTFEEVTIMMPMRRD